MNEILQKRIEEAAKRYCQDKNYILPDDIELSLEALTAIDAYIEAAKSILKNQWISVDEALPPIGKVYNDKKWSDWVLIRTRKGGVYLDSYIFHKHTWTNNGDDVTNWMEIPKLNSNECDIEKTDQGSSGENSLFCTMRLF